MSIVENFRKDLISRVYEFSSYTDIKPGVDNLSDVKVYNDRFKKMSNALRATVGTVASIAGRDKKYLQEFLMGFVNPVYIREFKYPEVALFKYDSTFNGVLTFDTAGTPVQFNEDRIQYVCDDFGPWTSASSYYELVFINGLLLNKDQYTMTNTSYGLKLFVKATNVKNDDTLTLVINKIYCNDYVYWEKIFVSPITVETTVITDIGNFKPLYHEKHLVLAYKTVDMPAYKLVHQSKYVIQTDSQNGQVRLIIRNQTYPANTRFKIINNHSFWDYSATGTTLADGAVPDILLYKDANSTESIVPYRSTRDFDVYFNGFKLEPEIHYMINNVSSKPNLTMMFRYGSSTPYTIRIVKNDVFYPEDSVLLTLDILPSDGLIELTPTNRISSTPKLGYAFLNNRFINNYNCIQEKISNIIQFKNIPINGKLAYTVKVPRNNETAAIIEELGQYRSESEIMVELLGGIDRAYVTPINNDPSLYNGFSVELDAITLRENLRGNPNFGTDYTWTSFDDAYGQSKIIIERESFLTEIAVYYINKNILERYDANVPYSSEYFEAQELLIDCNQYVVNPEDKNTTLDCNIV